MLEKIKTVLGILVAAAMLSSVTIFHPQEITDKILLKIIKLPEPIQPPKIVRVKEGDPLRIINAQINAATTREILAQLSGYESRAVGYPGVEEAYQYIKSQFEEIGLENITTETFTVTVPVDKGFALTIAETGETIPVYALWPNHVRTPTTPPEGLTGNLIYAGKGEFAALKGKKVEDSIVLMDFDSGQRFLNPRLLGAQAILFIDRGGVVQGEAVDKFLRVPVNVPRYWVKQEHSKRLLALAETGDTQVNLSGEMAWEQVPVKNIYAYLPGSDEVMAETAEGIRKWSDQLIVVEAFYDAMSIVPRLAPGAESACGITALVQLARSLKVYGNKHSVLLVATSGHFEGLAGINDFLYRHSRTSRHFRNKIPDPDKIDFDVFFGLDLTSHTDRVGSFCFGTFYNPGWATNHYVKNLFAPYSKKFATYVQQVFGTGADSLRYVNAIVPPQRTWKDFMPVPIGLDSEAVTFVGLKGMSFVSPDGGRERIDTPIDRIDRVNIPNLVRQIQTLAAIFMRASWDPELVQETKLKIQDQARDLTGQVVEFDRDVNFFVPKKPISGALVTYEMQGSIKSHSGVRSLQVTTADDNAEFAFRPLRRTGTIQLRSYKLDDAGQIVYAPDRGQEGDATYPLDVGSGSAENRTLQVIFPCRALDVFEIVDSRYLSALDNLTILGPNDAPPQWYGFDYVPNQSTSERRVTRAAVVYAKPGQRIKVLMGTSLFGIKYLLANAPEAFLLNPLIPRQVDETILEQALGQGYLIDQGMVRYPAYTVAKDTWVIDDIRLKQLARYGVENQRISALHEQARKALMEAREALRARDYERFVARAREAWGLEGRGYPDVKATADDTVKGIVFYFVLLLPFSFFMERLLFGFANIHKRLTAFAGIFVLIFLILSQVHPAFKLSTSPYIIFLAFVIFAMGFIVLTIVITKFNQEMRKMKQSASGMYEADIGRLSATAIAISLGISNLRKRKLRTGLTAGTITLLTFTVLSFTSITTSLKYYKLPRDNKPLYQGMLVRDRNWKGLQATVLDYLSSAFGRRATLIPRSWFMSQVKGEKAYFGFTALESQRHSYVNALLGLSAEEPQASKVDKMLVAGRWFAPGERAVCILPDDLATIVEIGPEEVGQAKIELFGTEFTVVGIIDTKRFNQIKDLDDEKLTPVDLVQEKGKIQQRVGEDPRLHAESPPEAFIHLEANNVILVPHEFVMKSGGTLCSIAITDFRGPDQETTVDFTQEIEEFLSRVALTVFVGYEERVNVYSSIGSTSISGIEDFLIPVLIAALIVLNTMMGAVHERFQEISIYSSVGLAPNHIAALFFAESAVFATVGAVLGYLIGQVLTLFLSRQGWLSGLALNYSSLSAVSSTMVVMATVFLSTIYPAKKAASMAVPDVERRWTFPEPDGDNWTFDFPFTIGGLEVVGMYAYLTRVFQSYEEGALGEFVTEDVVMTGKSLNGFQQYRISLMTWLAPYDLGISQKVTLDAMPIEDEQDLYKVVVNIYRESGDVASWQRINRRFLNVLRKRFLVWRTLSQDQKQEYARQGHEAVA